MKTCYIGVGSNIGNRKKNIENAIRFLIQSNKIAVRKISPLYLTKPVGGPSQRAYLNGVFKIQVKVSPKKLLSELLATEKALGRKRRVKWGPRVIDLDVLTYGKEVFHSKNLKVPHSHYPSRRFVLMPFCDLAPHFVHPILRVQNQTLLRRLTPLGQRATIWYQWKKDQFSRCKKSGKKKNQ